MFRLRLGKCIEEIKSLAVGLDGNARWVYFLLVDCHHTTVSLSNTLAWSNLFLVVMPSRCSLCLVETSLKNVRCNPRHLRVGFGRGDVNSWTRQPLLNEVVANYFAWPSKYELCAVDVISTPEDPSSFQLNGLFHPWAQAKICGPYGYIWGLGLARVLYTWKDNWSLVVC